ncbi:MAG: DUF3108 domain-containing protein [Pseudomonadota bacterium]|nr:DUF3108 domain-containing protein [Pseudomonadota bacterium]MDP1906452.1 DUF3108 domain-containing protein [Pseudomonadota bacterium]MDP2353135.1 DUF3108 domain-containing protein [Pseudomonadota bacterium]
MSRAHRILASALLISLAAHLLMLASAGSWWTPPTEEIPVPIEASLVAPPAKTEAAPAPAPAPPKPEIIQAAPVAPATVTPPAPSPAMEPEPVAAPAIATPPAPAVAVAPLAPVIEPPIPPPPPPPAPEPVVAEPAPPPALRKLPERLSLRYAVRAGDGGFNLGQAIYTWHQRDGHYTLVSIAQATGLASLFVSGKLAQTSEGRITAHGLRPEQYWLSRNEHRKDTAHFNWDAKRLVQGSDEVELPAGSQDLLSFPFHLAMTVDAMTTEWTLAVSNGRKLREYQFRNLGRVRLTIGETEIDTLHLQGSRSGEGTLDVWLAPSRHWLPQRIRTLDQKGKVMVLSLEVAS